MVRTGKIAVILFALALLIIIGCQPGAKSKRINTEVFKRVFGNDAVLNPDIFNTLSIEDTNRHYFDLNGDGRPEEVWFMDQDPRHNQQYQPLKWHLNNDRWQFKLNLFDTQRYQPLLVKAIDEDGDLEFGGVPDVDSDIYFADWKSDGIIDAAVDYRDLDGDQDVDEMTLYSIPDGKNIEALYSKDVGDDNLLIYECGYEYDQELCQWRSHFNGAEFFCFFKLSKDGKSWRAHGEAPFAFYDPDRDGVSEAAILIESEDQRVFSIIYSVDADGDATRENLRDYDFSISAWAPKKGFRFPDSLGDSVILRQLPSDKFLRYDAVKDFITSQVWQSMMLTWDENDNNVDLKGNPEQERWEGVIGEGNRYFNQVGGPASGKFNKRFEVVRKPTQKFSLYYLPSDRRIHLYYADKAWMEIDLDFNDKPEMRYDYLDTDRDGVIDLCRLDLKMDGRTDDEWNLANFNIMPISGDSMDISSIYQPALKNTVREIFCLDLRLKQALQKLGFNFKKDNIIRWIDSGLEHKRIPVWLHKKFLQSDESMRYYFEVVKDRLIWQLKRRYANEQFWNKFNRLRSRGEMMKMRDLLEEEFKLDGSEVSYDLWLQHWRAPAK